MGKVRIYVTVALAIAFLALLGCEGGAGMNAGKPTSDSVLSLELRQALSEIEALPIPDGVDAAAFNEIKAALRRLLIERGSNKFISTAPKSDRSKVVDLAVTPAGSDAQFHWSYRNEGDFSQNGIVDVGDLTPIGVHFGKDSSAADWNIARVADGDGNGIIGLPDLVSIGANFLYTVAGYHLQRSNTPDPGGTWNQVTDVPFAASTVPAGQMRQFDFTLVDATPGYYRVVPYDAVTAGIASDVVQLSASSGRGDWWMFGHDPQHTRRSPYVGPATMVLKWVFTTGGAVYSSPAIGADGTVYVGSDDNNLYAISPDGSMKWSFNAGNYVESSPAIATDGTLYVGSHYGTLAAINPNGTQKWVVWTGGAIYSSPVIGPDGTVYAGCTDGKVYAVNPDGSVKWDYTTGDDIYSSPALGADGTLYVGSWDNKLYAINPDGSQKWSYDTQGCVHSSPSIGADGTVYVGSWNDGLYAINQDGSLKWKYPIGVLGGGVSSSPAIGADGTVYVGGCDNQFYAVNSDGSLKWAFTTGDWVVSSPSIDADGTLYFASYDKNFYVVNPDGSLKWSYTTELGVESSPAIGADGTVYVGSWDGSLYAFGPGGGGNEPPIAALTATPDSGTAPLDLILNAGGSNDSDGTISKYEFDFGEGGGWQDNGASATIAHTYDTAGSYTAQVRVTDDDGALDTEAVAVNVTMGGNQPPVAALTATPDSGAVPLGVILNASGSTDTDGIITKYEFDFGEGSGWQDNGVDSTIQHIYNTNGNYTAAVRVTDDDGAMDTAEVAINVGQASLYDEIENNDSFAQANSLSFPVGPFHGSIGGKYNDEYDGYDEDSLDYFKFHCEDKTQISGTLQFDDSTLPGLSIALYDPAFELVQRFNGSGNIISFVWGLKAAQGADFYYLVLEPNPFSGFTDYTLNASFSYPGWDETEDNDSFSHANTLSFPLADFLGHIGDNGYDGDSLDYFRFHCDDKTRITGSMEFDDATLSGLELNLYDPAFQLVHRFSGSGNIINFNWGLRTAQGSDYYYLVLEPNPFSGFTYYNIPAATFSHPGWDETENNDSFSQANSLSLPVYDWSGSCGDYSYDGDSEDYAKFTLATSATVNIVVDTDATNSLVLDLHNSAGDFLERDSANSGHAAIVTDLTAGTYYVYIHQNPFSDPNNYLLDIW